MRMFAAMMFASTISFAQDQILGKWWTPEKDGKLEVYKTGSKYYGGIIWGKNGTRKDTKNPDPSLRNQTIVGSTILKDFVYDAEDKVWNKGTIYDPNNGKTYDCKISLSRNQQEMNVRGYIGISLLGRTETFTRVTE